MSNETAKATWRADDERLKILMRYFFLCEQAFDRWDLQGIHTYLKSIRRVMAGKLSTRELDDVTKKMNELQVLKDKTKNDRSAIMDFYNLSDEIYIILNTFGKEHGLFFGEREDDEGL